MRRLVREAWNLLQEPTTELGHHRGEVDLTREMSVVSDELELRVEEVEAADGRVVVRREAGLPPQLGGSLLCVGVVASEQLQTRPEVVMILTMIRQAPRYCRGEKCVDLVDRTLPTVVRHTVRVVHLQFDAARGRDGLGAEHSPRLDGDSLGGLVLGEFE